MSIRNVRSHKRVLPSGETTNVRKHTRDIPVHLKNTVDREERLNKEAPKDEFDSLVSKARDLHSKRSNLSRSLDEGQNNKRSYPVNEDSLKLFNKDPAGVDLKGIDDKKEKSSNLPISYKGYTIIDDQGLITTIDDKGSKFIVALDDSKESGARKIVQSKNNVTTAKNYIDWVTKGDETKKTVSVDYKSDLDYDTLYRAHSWISFSPERRARQVQDAYLNDIEDFEQEVRKYTNDEKEVRSEVERYRAGLKNKYSSWIGAVSRTMSPMITGPAKFPTRRAENANRSERNRSEELSQFKQKAKNSLKRKYTDSGVIKGSDSDAVEKLKKRVSSEKNLLEEMKRINAEYRKKGSLDKIDMSPELRKMAKDNFNYRPESTKPFFGFQLTNTRGRLKQAEDRLQSIEKKQERGTKEYVRNGVRIVENVDDDRLQLFFDGIPDVDIRTKLKRNGFRWSPRNQAWQRQLTNNARYSLRFVFGD